MTQQILAIILGPIIGIFLGCFFIYIIEKTQYKKKLFIEKRKSLCQECKYIDMCKLTDKKTWNSIEPCEYFWFNFEKGNVNNLK